MKFATTILALFATGALLFSQAATAQQPGAGQFRLPRDLHGFTGPVTDLSFSPDGQFLAAAGGKEVRLYQVSTGRLLKTLRGQIDNGSFGDCLAVAFSPDNCHLVVGISNYTSHGSLRVYDTDNFHQIDELVAGHELPVTELAFSSDARYLATADTEGGIQIFDWPLRKIVGRAEPRGLSPQYKVFQFPLDDLFLVTGEDDGFSVISAPAGRRLGADPRIRREVARWINEQPDVNFPGAETARHYALQLSRDAYLASGTSGGKQWVGFWQGGAADPKLVYRQHSRPVTSLALTTTCTVAASGDAMGDIHLWDVETGQTLHTLKSVGQPIYRAAFDAQQRRLGFTPLPGKGSGWTYNAFGKIDRQFDFNMRGVFGASEEGFPEEITSQGRAALKIVYDQGKNQYGLNMNDSQGLSKSLKFPVGVVPSCYSLLNSGQLGLATPMITADFSGGLYGWDLNNVQKRRIFLGHEAMVTSLTESSDRKYLISSSTDRTIRFWNLKNTTPTAWVGFQHAGQKVTEVLAGSAAERADIRVGDRFVALDGLSLNRISAMQADGAYPYRIGQRVRVTLERQGVVFETELPLIAGPDLVEPDLSMLILDDGRWIVCTAEGYFDASPATGDLVGFHINRGVNRAADFVPLHQFRSHLYRPDVIDRVLRGERVSQAIEQANAGLDVPEVAIDLRDTETIETMAPPEVRVLRPTEGMTTKKPIIHVLGEVISHEDHPVTDVRIMVNGRPGMAKGMTVVAADAEPQSRLSFNKAVNLLPGENTISIFASNVVAPSVPMPINVSYESTEAVRPRRSKQNLVSIGVSDYKNPQLNLRFAHLDAEKFADAWQNQRGVLYQEVQSRVLLNEDADSETVRTALVDLLDGVQRGDVAVIFISAHGVRDADLDYYVATHDVDGKDLPHTAVHFTAITELLENLSCKVLVFVDTCHSQGITGVKALLRDPLYELSSEEYGAVVFASSLSREYSMEHEKWGHGAFTKAILDTFESRKSDLDRDGYLSLTEMEKQVYDQVQKMTEKKQTPVMSRPSTIPNLRFYAVGGASSP